MVMSSLTAIATTLAGAASLSASSYAHLRYFKKAPSTWTALKLLFVNPDETTTPTPIPTATRNAAFASGLLFSGLSLAESQFGQVGLALSGSLHPFGEVLIAGGFLVGLGSQLARGSFLSHGLSCRAAALPSFTALTTAMATAVIGQNMLSKYLYLDSAAAVHSFDAVTIYDGPSMVAFTAAGLAFVALKNQIVAKQSVKPVGAAFGTGIGIGLGVGCLNLCNADQILSTLSISANASPALIMGIGTTMVLNRILNNLAGVPAVNPTTLPSTSRTVIGSSLCGLGLGLTGLTPVSAVVGLSSGSASFWLFSSAMVAGAGSVYLSRAARSYYDQKTQAKSLQVN